MSIKIITKPKVYIVGSTCHRRGLPDFLEDQGVPDWQTDAQSSGEMIVETGGRLCYESFARPRPGGNKAYIDHILEVGHGSVLEHAVYTLIFTGISRSCSHEIVRHRHLSPSQLSQRYVDESDVAFVLPPIMNHCGVGAYVAWESHCERTLQLYSELVDHFMELIDDVDDKTARRKQAREAARSVLPNCAETKIQLTGNARAWRNFIELRGSVHADAEIRRLAEAVLSVLANESPNIFGDYTTDADGSITTPYRKV